MGPEAAGLVDALAAAGATVAVAESFTGGLVMDAFVGVPGASDVFLGGVVAYADDAKRELLGVPRKVLRAYGAVSRETAIAMAAGARNAFGSDFAVSTTGIAGPTGATAEKPLGLAYACATDGRNHLVTRRTHAGDRDAVRRLGTNQALELLGRILEGAAAGMD